MPFLRCVLVLGLTFGARVSPAPGQAPLPLDPLTPTERAAADSIARADRRVRESLTGQARLVSAQFIAVKPAERDADVPARRHAEVLYLLPSNTGLLVLVDLERRQVVDLQRSPGESVPLSREEVDRAVRLALADQRVIQLFGGTLPGFRPQELPTGVRDTSATRVEAIRTLATGPNDPCYRRRCVVIFFRVENRYQHLNRVFVDLLANRVMIRGPQL